jgi:tRNA(fMet)-specific endonuclease VapC
VTLLLDTTAVSDLMHRRPWALDRLRQLKPMEVLLSAPVLAEIRFGLERLEPGSRRRALLEAELDTLQGIVGWADWDEPAARRFGALKASLQAAGAPVDDMDLVIASIAMTLDAAVATSNVKHFERVDGLAVENWA